MRVIESLKAASYHADNLGFGLEESHLKNITGLKEQISKNQKHNIFLNENSRQTHRLDFLSQLGISSGKAFGN